MEFAEEIRDFLIESNENLANLDQEIVELEQDPKNEKLIASVFRTIHTIKGTSGFFGFDILGSITHVTENILGQVREKQRELTPDVVSLVLETVDAVRAILVNVEENGAEGKDIYEVLRQRLEHAYQSVESPGSQPLDSTEPPHEERRNAERVADDRLEAERIESTRLAAKGAAPHEQLSVPPEAKSEAAVLLGHSAPELKIQGSMQAKDLPGLIPGLVHSSDGEPQSRRRTEDQNSATSTIRVEVSLLDKLMNLVGELVLARNQILQEPSQSASTSAAAQRLNLITSELQEGVMRTRMQPIGVVWNKLPRVVRDLASGMGKKIEIVMEGAETELDKTIIEAIKDPLTHIVRNSCDHGIETTEQRIAKGKKPEGTILLRAFHEGGHVNIEISDDGAGFDTERMKKKAIEKGFLRVEQAATMTEWEALRLIFHPGFSTAEKVTSISGRGVGMDVVKTNIEKISGTVDLANREGAGSTIKIKIPLTLAIIPGLIVSIRSTSASPADERMTDLAANPSREHRFVIPQANLLELLRLEGAKHLQQIEKIHGSEVYRRRGKLLPLAYLSDLLGLQSARKPKDVINIVVVKAEDTEFGLVVDDVNDTQEIVVKALGKQLKSLGCYLGATIMGDGKIALILDVIGVARLANLLAPLLERSHVGSKLESNVAETDQMMLLFRSGKFPRLVLPLSLVARLEEIATVSIEYGGGLPVVRYREAILPLVSLSKLLDPGYAAPETDAETLQVIVFSESGQYVGMVVDEILDIVDDSVTIKRAGSAFGLLGSGIVGGKVTDFVDLDALLSGTRISSGGGLTAWHGDGKTLLLIDRRKIPRGIMRSFLEMHGHKVYEFAEMQDAINMVQRATPDLILVSIEPEALSVDVRGTCNLVRTLRHQPKTQGIPLIGMTRGSIGDAGEHQSLLNELMDEIIDVGDRSSILASIHGSSRQNAGGTEGLQLDKELLSAGRSQ